MTIPEELVERLQRGEVVLFIGAGISRNAGLPGWVELIGPLSKLTGGGWPAREADINTEHLLTMARYYENKFGRNALIRFLQDKLDTTTVPPSSIHYAVSLLPVKTLFTTNFDDLLERGFQALQIPHQCIVREPELAYWREDQVQIIKLCGDLSRPESIQITRADFNTYLETHSRLIESLRTTLETRTALFLGYSLHDPFLNQVWDSIGSHFGHHQRTAYAVMFDLAEPEAEDLKTRNIYPIELQHEGTTRQKALLEFLAILISWTKNSNLDRFNNILQRIPDPDVLNMVI